jgi:hypothetical protein
LGVTKAKHKIARATGVPTTRSGRQRKFGALLGKLMGWPVVLAVLIVKAVFSGQEE